MNTSLYEIEIDLNSLIFFLNVNKKNKNSQTKLEKEIICINLKTLNDKTFELVKNMKLEELNKSVSAIQVESLLKKCVILFSNTKKSKELLEVYLFYSILYLHLNNQISISEECFDTTSKKYIFNECINSKTILSKLNNLTKTLIGFPQNDELYDSIHKKIWTYMLNIKKQTLI